MSTDVSKVLTNMNEKLFSETDFENILERRFMRSDLKFMSCTIKPLSDNIEGYMGDHYKMVIIYLENKEEKKEYFFVKTMPMKNDIQMQVANESGIYNTEIFLYNYLFPEFEKLGLDTSFAPKCYYCIPGKTMVMEDLNKKGFVIPERRQWYSMTECQCGLASLARLHAASYAYEAIKSNEMRNTFIFLEQYPEMFQERLFNQYLDVSGSGHGQKWTNSSMDMCKFMVDYLPKSEHYKNEFKQRLDKLKLGEIFAQESHIKKVICHGDLWSNNMLFKRENNTTTLCVIVDYQITRYFYPAFDVLNFIYSNTTAEFRRKYLDNLKNFYYSVLTETMKNYGYSVDDFYPTSDYEKSLEIVNFHAMFHAFASHTFAFLPIDQLNKSVNEKKNEIKELLFHNRAMSTLEAFNNDEEYKQIVIEEMEQLLNLLE